MSTATYELPYEGAKKMLLVDDVDNTEFLAGLFNAMYNEIPTMKNKKTKVKAFSLMVNGVHRKASNLKKTARKELRELFHC